MNRQRRAVLRSVSAITLMPAVVARAQAPWPTRTVRIISPWPAGGPADALIRISAVRTAIVRSALLGAYSRDRDRRQGADLVARVLAEAAKQ